MRVCMILEGCYPYVRGGVSSWAHQYMSESPDIEFVLWTIHASEKDTRTNLYELPANVVAHHRIILNEAYSKSRKAIASQKAEGICDAMRAILFGDENGWERLTALLQAEKPSLWSLVNSEAFWELARDLSDKKEGIGLTDAYFSLHSMMLPVCHVLSAAIPEADIYHSAVAGYGGLLGAMAAIRTGKPFVLTEHGIYPREREEELLTADWTTRALRTVWTELFYGMSRFAYRQATAVTSLFSGAMERQIAIGCNKARCRIIPNGIMTERFGALEAPKPSSVIHIGAFVRFAAIKDLKTMIHAFYALRQEHPNTILHLMGGIDDENYRDSCIALIHRLHLTEAIRIEGHVDPLEYMEKMDMTVLSSISEGQPLTLLESMVAGRPCVATRVGNCQDMIEKPMGTIGPAGICCTPMSPQELADAMGRLCADSELRMKLGNNGRKRVAAEYQLATMLAAYHQLYQEVRDHGRHWL